MNRGTAFDSDNPNEFTPLLPGPDSDAAPCVVRGSALRAIGSMVSLSIDQPRPTITSSFSRAVRQLASGRRSRRSQSGDARERNAASAHGTIDRRPHALLLG